MKTLALITLLAIGWNTQAGISWNGHELKKPAKQLITERITKVCPNLIQLEMLNVVSVDIYDFDPHEVFQIYMPYEVSIAGHAEKVLDITYNFTFIMSDTKESSRMLEFHQNKACY